MGLVNREGVVALRELIEAQIAVEIADGELVQAIMDARGAGLSLRAIAGAACLSHEKIRQILKAD